MKEDKKIDVSYIFSIYRRFGIENGLSCFLNQNTILNREVIVVDDASTDNAIDFLKEAFDKHNIDYKIIRNSKNLGPSCSFNIGANNARGKYLVFVDADDFFPYSVEQIVFNTIEKENGDFIFGKTAKIDENISKEEMDSISNLNHFHYKVIDKEILNYIMSYTRIAATYLMVKREVFLKTQGFDERCFIQDVPIFLRLAINSNRLIYVQNCLFFFKKSYGTLSSRTKQVNKDGFNSYYYFLNDNQNNISKKDGIILRKLIISMLYKAFKRSRIKSGNYLAVLYFYIKTKLGFDVNLERITLLKSLTPRELFE